MAKTQKKIASKSVKTEQTIADPPELPESIHDDPSILETDDYFNEEIPF